MAKKEIKVIGKPFITAAVSLGVVAVLSFLSSLFNSVGLLSVSSLMSIFIFTGMILISVGFYYLGKRYDSKLIMRTVIAGFVLYMLLFVFIASISDSYQERAFELNNTLAIKEVELNQLKIENASVEVIESFEKELFEFFLEEGLPLLVPFIIVLLLFAVYFTFFGIGVIRLEKVRYSKPIGLLTVISAWLVPTGIGIILAIPLSIAVYVLTILMFLDESKKAKE